MADFTAVKNNLSLLAFTFFDMIDLKIKLNVIKFPNLLGNVNIFIRIKFGDDYGVNRLYVEEIWGIY